MFAQTNRFSAAVRKLLSIKGEEHAVGFGVHLEDERPEHSFIKGERLWVQYNEVTSAAGTLSYVAIQNRANSGLVAVITHCHITLTTAPASVSFNLLIPVQAVLGGPMWFRDTRWSASALGSTTLCKAAAAGAYGATALIDTIQVPVAEQIIDYIGPAGRIPNIVLGPGTEAAVAVTAVGVNTLKAFFAGYERPLESGELSPA